MTRINTATRVMASIILAAFAGSAIADDKDKHKVKEPANKKVKVVTVPEPATLALLGAGVVALALRSFLRRRKD